MTLSSVLLCVVLLGTVYEAAAFASGGAVHITMAAEMEKMDKAAEAAKFLYNLATEQKAKAQDVYQYEFAIKEPPYGAGEQQFPLSAYYYRNKVAVNKISAMEAAADFSMPEEPKEAGAQYKNRYFRNG